ncbi:hypothetical protein NUV89_17720 [Pseudomonas sp. 18.1.10]|uniref:hypothetical protein n=1 Tax=Pseudomonas sp. 18.1.10 TaxID=2969302 RepID=UPI00214F8FCA|nr:hypothetical protein [Pseudomonas sp. 18.1.10]MCR4540229.1 hypothetical protein [Pseudomonas sp. 18.1.10]
MRLMYRYTLAALMLTNASMANAAMFVDYVHVAGAQCIGTSINDSGQAVGNCLLPSASANNVPWVATAPGGSLQPLAALVSGQPCRVGGITNSGWIVGDCSDASNIEFSVIWSTSNPGTTPTKLNPLPRTLLFPLLRPADVQTHAITLSQQGAVLAQSISASGNQTVVLYIPGSGTPIRISTFGDNCAGIDVNSTLIYGYPSLLMNCLGTNAKPVPTVATRGVSGYNLNVLPVPTDASYCLAAGMNDQSQIVGTCVFPDSDDHVPQTAFWATPSSLPKLLTLPLNAKNQGIAINNAGHILARRGDSTGIPQNLFWGDPKDSFGIRPIVPLPGSITTKAVDFAHNDTIVLTCENSAQYTTACTWTPDEGTQALAPINGGLKSQLTSISPTGKFVVGGTTDTAQNINAAAATLF